MKCPDCKKDNYCGCKSCKPTKGMDNRRSFRFVKGDFIKCGYCRKTIRFEAWEDESAPLEVKQKIEELNKS